MGDGVWYREGLRFACTECGNCCGGAPGYVWLTREEMAKIAGFLGLDVKVFARRYVRRVGFRFSLIEKADYDCVFLRRADGKATCAIYPVRPLQCRTWPFWNVNVKTPESWAEAAGNCPGMNCGEVRELAHIEKVRTARQWSDVP
ncbi:MAG: YkgJ family cysteine cluster protein [Phycisphaerae bacterium]